MRRRLMPPFLRVRQIENVESSTILRTPLLLLLAFTFTMWKDEKHQQQDNWSAIFKYGLWSIQPSLPSFSILLDKWNEWLCVHLSISEWRQLTLFLVHLLFVRTTVRSYGYKQEGGNFTPKCNWMSSSSISSTVRDRERDIIEDTAE